jgi:hypothetical protein
LFFVRAERPASEPLHAPIASAVIASSGWRPNVGQPLGEVAGGRTATYARDAPKKEKSPAQEGLL